MVRFAHGLSPETERRGLEEHLDGCGDCRRLCAALVQGEAAEAPTMVQDAFTLVDDALPRGTPIGRYVVLDRLGAGGMGVVYSAYDPELDRRISVKLIRSGSQQPAARARLQREAQAMARLAHAHVVAVHDVGGWRGRVYVVMDLIEGPTLGEWCRAQPRRWTEVLRCYLQAGAGLAAAHQVGLVHRDFKPANALVGRDGVVRVTDFGLARFSSGPESLESATPTPGEPARPDELTRPGEVAGTPPYMAPEQHRAGPIDARTDQFSFAVALYEALFGARPYTVQQLGAAGPGAPPPPLESGPRGAEVPRAVRLALARALSVDPDQRFPAMGDLLSALERARTSRRRALAAAAVVAAAVLIPGGALASRRWAERACRAEASPIQGAWNREAEERIRAAFQATGSPLAADAARLSSARLGSVAEAWGAQAQESCLAVRVRRERSESLWALQRACLDERRMELEQLVQLFGAADRAVVEASVEAAHALPSTARCAEVEALARQEREADPSTADARRGLRAELARARALLAAGRWKEARPRLEGALGGAQAIKARALEAQALELLGGAAQQGGDAKAAEESFARAAVAAESAGEDLLGAQALVSLASVVGKGQRAREGRRWADLAEALLQRLGKPEPLLSARLADTRAWIAYDQRELDLAMRQAADALEVRERHLGEDHPETARGRLTLGTMANGKGDREAAMAAYQRALTSLERALGKEHPAVARALHGLGAVSKHAGRYAEALDYYQRSLVLRERLNGPDHPEVAATLNNVGTTLIVSGRPEEAIAPLTRSLAIVERTHGADHINVALGLANLGLAEAKRGRPEVAIPLLERARAIAEKRYGPDHDAVASALAYLGVAQERSGRPRQAVATLEQALGISEKRIGADNPGLLLVLEPLASAVFAAGDPERAVQVADRALKLKEIGASPAKLADLRLTLARALGALGREADRARAEAALAEAGFRAAGRNKEADEAAAVAAASR